MPGEVPTAVDQYIFVNGIFGSKDNGWERYAADYINTLPGKAGTSFFTFTGLMRFWESQHADALAKVINGAHTAAHGGRVCVVAHSDGCPTTRKALQRNAGTLIDDAFLLAAADLRDCGNGGNGLNKLLADNRIGRVILGVSTGDMILKFNWLTPSFWGCTLGHDGPTGFENSATATRCRFVDLPTVSLMGRNMIVGEDDGMGHCDWVDGKGGFNKKTVDTVLAMGSK